MIDFIKLDISHCAERVKNNPKVALFRPIDENTGECKDNRYGGIHKNMLIKLRGGTYMTLEGSLHKYFNHGTHNHNDFGFHELRPVINDLAVEYEFDPQFSAIHNMEFGVNITIPFNPSIFLNSQIINYKGQPKEKNAPINRKGRMVTFERTNYLIKFYDKSAQYNLRENILRFEIRTKRMELIKSTGIRTLSDLLDLSKLQKLTPFIVESFNDIWIYDKVDEEMLSRDDLVTYLHGINDSYWIDLKPERKIVDTFGEKKLNPEYKNQRRKYDTARRQFLDMLERNNLNRTKTLLLKLILDKCNQLTQKEN